MGMITRVRGRIRANSLVVDKEKAAQSVCLLSAILLLPYCPRGPLPLLPSPGPIIYTAFVLPVILSANYVYPVSSLKLLIQAIKGGAIRRAWNPLNHFFIRLYRPIDRAENMFLNLRNISVMTNQIVFFALADKLLVPQQRMTSLYTLMFYNVIAYCVGYVKELVEKEDWSPYVTLTERSNIKHLAMSVTKIVLEWTKAVTFVVTVTFTLLVFGLEQGLEHYTPSTFYTIITWIYYAATEKVFADMFPTVLGLLQLDLLENMENLYAPVVLRGFTVCVSALFSVILLYKGNDSVDGNGRNASENIKRGYTSFRLVVIAIYLNVYLRAKETMLNSGAVLQRERQLLDRYRKATPEEIERFDDVCAVCLSIMTKARVTPCHHLFHADCLRQCLNTSDTCPMCKQELKFD